MRRLTSSWLVRLSIALMSCACSSSTSGVTPPSPDGGTGSQDGANECSCTVNGVAIPCGVPSCVNGTTYTCANARLVQGDACGAAPCPLATNGPAPGSCDGATQYCIEIGKLTASDDGGFETKVSASACVPRPSGCADCDCIGDANAAWTAAKHDPVSCGASAQIACEVEDGVVTQICLE